MKTIILVAIFTICYVVCMDLVNKYMSSLNFDYVEENNETVSESNIYEVTILGCVVNPGQYTVSKDSTLGYLITLAGGLTEEADVTTFNSNATLVNEGSYYISYKREDQNKISLNTATQAMLDTLPGIGEVLAKRIIDYRLSKGNFKTIEDIKNVQGIGDSLFENLKDLLCL